MPESVQYIRIFAGGTPDLSETRITSITILDNSEISQSYLQSAEEDIRRIRFRCFGKLFCAKQLSYQPEKSTKCHPAGEGLFFQVLNTAFPLGTF